MSNYLYKFLIRRMNYLYGSRTVRCLYFFREFFLTNLENTSYNHPCNVFINIFTITQNFS